MSVSTSGPRPTRRSWPEAPISLPLVRSASRTETTRRYDDAIHDAGQSQQEQRGGRSPEQGARRRDGGGQRGDGEGRRDARGRWAPAELEGRAQHGLRSEENPYRTGPPPGARGERQP